MIELNVDEVAGLARVRLTGRLSKEDYETFVPAMEGLIEKKGKIRVLVEMHDFHGWTAGALWEDTKFDVRHFSDISRLAMVGEKKWQQGMAAFCKPFTTARVRYFDLADKAAAEEWLGEAETREA